MLALLPLDGGGTVRVALPIFDTIAVCGLSAVSDVPTTVDVGYFSCDLLISILRMRLLLRSVITRFPALSRETL